MIPKEVFHYTKASTAINHILLDKKLRLSQLRYTNDPKESKLENIIHLQYNLYNGLPADQFFQQMGMEQMLVQTARIIKLHEWKVLCVSKNHPDLEIKKASYPVDTFLSGSFRPAMWAHYANTYDPKTHSNLQTGVCLKFNGNSLDKQMHKTFKDSKKYTIRSGHVEYNDLKLFDLTHLNFPNITKLNKAELKKRLRSHFIKNYEEIFLRKSEDWENEHEFRWLMHSVKDAPEYISIIGTLEEVLIGDDFPNKWLVKLFGLCKKLQTPLKRVTWENGIPFGIPIHY